MAKLVYSAIASLDGYVADGDGGFGWAVPDEEVHAFVNDLQRPIGTHLYGRRMYETMAGWETDPTLADHSPLMRDFAELWQAADKVVYSRTLEAATTARTRIERNFDPEAVRELKVSAGQDIVIGGPNIAAQAFGAGLVDDCHLFVAPVVVGGGKRALPSDIRLELELQDERRFGNGMVYLRYRIKAGGDGSSASTGSRAFRGPILFSGVRGETVWKSEQGGSMTYAPEHGKALSER